jgi:hypothetical protein
MGWQGLQPATPSLFTIYNTVRGTLGLKRESNMNWFKTLLHGIGMRRKGYVLMQSEDGSWWWVGYD